MVFFNYAACKTIMTSASHHPNIFACCKLCACRGGFFNCAAYKTKMTSYAHHLGDFFVPHALKPRQQVALVIIIFLIAQPMRPRGQAALVILVFFLCCKL